MSISVYPAPTGGGIKSVQRGLASSSGNITITAVDIAKSFVTVYGTTSSGTVAVTGDIGSSTGTLGSGGGGSNVMASFNFNGGSGSNNTSTISEPSRSINLNSSDISGGSNNLVTAVVQGYLSNSTTLVVSGACRWEVVEFN